MPSFDVVSEIEQHELVNAIDQANREISTRFDFKGTNSKVELSEWVLTIISKSEFQVKQINNILENKINKRGIDIRCLEYGEIQLEYPNDGNGITGHDETSEKFEYSWTIEFNPERK